MSLKNKNSNTTNKITYQMLEQERNMLKITLEYVAKENEELKQQLEDMKMTVRTNKELLKEYVDKITNKDMVVEKMDATIEQLTTRMHSLEEFIKQSQLHKIKDVKSIETKSVNKSQVFSHQPILTSHENIMNPPTKDNFISSSNINCSTNITNLNSRNINYNNELPPRSKTPKKHETSIISANSFFPKEDKTKEVIFIFIKVFFKTKSNS